MTSLLISTLCVLSIVSSILAGCSKQLIPELSFFPTGKSLAWPHDTTKNTYTTSGRYIPRNIIPTRMQISKNEAILALPRLKPGVPITLGVLPLNKKHCGAIAPFPCWSIQEEGNCEALQNAVDIVLDIQEILWVLDSGIVNTLTQPIRRCPPKVVGIDIKTGKIVKIVDLSSLVSSASQLQYMVVDYAENGKVFLYITDAANRAIIVYDVTANRGFRVGLPKAVNLGNALTDVLYIALVYKSDGSAVLYFTYLNSSRVFSIKACHLRSGATNGAIVDEGPKSNKIVFLGTDGGSSIFFRNKGNSDVYLWNVNTAFGAENFAIVQKGNECRLPTTIVPGNKNSMWTLESNFHDYIQNKVPCAGASVAIHPLVKSC